MSKIVLFPLCHPYETRQAALEDFANGAGFVNHSGKLVCRNTIEPMTIVAIHYRAECPPLVTSV